MKNFNKNIRKILFPHPALIIVLVPFSAAFLIYSLIFLGTEDIRSYISYVLAFYTLVLICVRIPDIVRFAGRVKKENRIISKLSEDTHLRVRLSLYGNLVWNTAYGIFQLGLGFFHRSVWFFSLAVYYICLALMRFFLARYVSIHVPGEDPEAEYRRSRLCGVILMLMSSALAVIVFYVTLQNKTSVHSSITTIAMAAYTFTSVTVAVVNMIRYRKYNSPVYSAAKAVGFAAALVSVLNLETAMLAAFGEDTPELSRKFLTGMTGGVILLVILVTAVLMVVRSAIELKGYRALKQNKR